MRTPKKSKRSLLEEFPPRHENSPITPKKRTNAPTETPEKSGKHQVTTPFSPERKADNVDEESFISSDTQDVVYDEEEEESLDAGSSDSENDEFEKEMGEDHLVPDMGSFFDSSEIFREPVAGLRTRKTSITKQLSRALQSRSFNFWVVAEWVVSDMDRAILDYWLELEWAKREDALTKIRKDSSKTSGKFIKLSARKVFKCRRFSKKFIDQEKLIWEQLRELYRYLQFSQGQWNSKIMSDLEFLDRLPNDVPNPFLVNQQVTGKPYYVGRGMGWPGPLNNGIYFNTSFFFFYLVLFPYEKMLSNGKSLHPYSMVTGTVIAVDPIGNRYKIQFDIDELGREYVADTNIMGHGSDLRIPCLKPGPSPSLLSTKRDEIDKQSSDVPQPEEPSKNLEDSDIGLIHEKSIQDQSIIQGTVSVLTGGYEHSSFRHLLKLIILFLGHSYTFYAV